MTSKTKVASFTVMVFLIITIFSSNAHTKPPRQTKSKFYDFSEQLIDGQIKKPTSLYIDSRDKVKFERLLRLKKSFLPKLFDTAKEKVFK
tara:strand:+ start:1546 stop:1815 length:270 start_codon:yes stop_codon:yes gene_type:complete